MKKYPLLLLWSLMITVLSTAQEADSIQTLDQLKEAIEEVLEETNTPAVGVTLVDTSGPIWIAGLGTADKASDRKADENTMFRIGSTTKMFASLSILKLQEEGKVNLKDKVRDLVPEIEFTNPWAETNPILVEHLLEHTTGWDDIHLPEYGYQMPDSEPLKKGLDYHPHSRISRWVPGTRMSYCNAGPPVAAYIVEKLTDEVYEDYVQRIFFDPMGVENMTYFQSDIYKEIGATLYQGEEPQPYWHIAQRPSGSINASAKDMSKMVQFFVDRARIDSVQIISEASLKRMEMAMTTLGSEAGLEVGYGLSNYTSTHKSFLFQGHNGGVNGGLTDMAYLPSHGVGYAVMINSGSGGAIRKIADLVKDYLTKDFAESSKSLARVTVSDAPGIDGFYMPVSPRTQMFHFVEKVMNTAKIWSEGDSVYWRPVTGGNKSSYLQVGKTHYASPNSKLISMVQTTDPLAGAIVQRGMATYQKVSSIKVFGQLAIGGLWAMGMVISVLFAILWGIRYFMGKVNGGYNVRVRFWPLLATLFMAISFICMTIGGANPFEILAGPSVASVGIMLCTILFGITALWSVIYVIRARKTDVDGFAYWFSTTLSILHLIVALYFLANGVIGLQTWA